MADPKLKTAMNEVMAILQKHDIAGQVTLVSQTHSEFRMKIDPSWSCASLYEVGAGVAIRFNASKKSIPDKEERWKKAELTTHIFCQIRDLCGQYFLAMEGAIKDLGKYTEIEHRGGTGYEPHVES